MFKSSKVTKLAMGEWIETVADILDKSEAVIQYLVRLLYLSKLHLIVSQRSVIKLKEEMKSDVITDKNAQIQLMLAAVKAALKDEIRSYSDVAAARTQPAPTPLNNKYLNTTTIQSAVRKVIERDDRKKDSIVYGLQEKPRKISKIKFSTSSGAWKKSRGLKSTE